MRERGRAQARGRDGDRRGGSARAREREREFDPTDARAPRFYISPSDFTVGAKNIRSRYSLSLSSHLSLCL